MRIRGKKYYKTGKGLLGLIDKILKPLGVLFVAAFLLAAYSLASADDLKMHQMMEAENKVSKPVEEVVETAEACEVEETEEVNQLVNSDEETTTWESLGEFRITAYCGGECCCGIWADEDCTTASGAKAVEGITVAADTDILPMGTVIRIDGHEYTVQDTGSAVKGNVIDVYFTSHSDALSHGVKYQEVEVKR
jgi:3D (Asp-Asp-Asp) domain-containing protein